MGEKYEIIAANLAAQQEKVDGLKKQANDLLKGGSFVDYNKTINKLNEAVKLLNEHKVNLEYARLSATDRPLIEAVKTFFVKVSKVVEEKDKDTGNIDAVIIDDDRNSRINLENFCKFAEIDTEWARECSELLSLLVLRETKLFELTESQLDSKSFYFIKQVRAKQAGETPDSNTKIVAKLQSIVDKVVFEPLNDEHPELNKYKCTSHDLVFIHDAITNLDSKERCSIKMMNDRQFKSVMMSVFAHMLGEKYEVKASGKPATKKK